MWSRDGSRRFGLHVFWRRQRLSGARLPRHRFRELSRSTVITADGDCRATVGIRHGHVTRPRQTRRHSAPKLLAACRNCYGRRLIISEICFRLRPEAVAVNRDDRAVRSGVGSRNDFCYGMGIEIRLSDDRFSAIRIRYGNICVTVSVRRGDASDASPVGCNLYPSCRSCAESDRRSAMEADAADRYRRTALNRTESGSNRHDRRHGPLPVRNMNENVSRLVHCRL